MRAHCAAVAARFSVAAVVGGQRKRGCASSSGRMPSAVHSLSWILWWTMPAFGLPSGTCIFSMNSISTRASSRMSGTLFFFSGMFSLPSPKSPAVPCASARSYWFSIVQAEMPPLTTYLP